MMLRCLSLLLLTLSPTFAQYSGDHTTRNGGKCEYFVRQLNNWYAEGARTFDPSPIDTSVLHAALEDIKHGLRKPWYFISGSDTLEAASSKDTMAPTVVQSFHFKDAPRLALLRYEWYYLNQVTYAYVAYFGHTGEWYLLDNGWDNGSSALIENYNNMLATHSEDLAGLCAECRAVMLVSILFSTASPVFVVSNCAEIAIAEIWGLDRYGGGLFVLSTVGDTLVVPKHGNLGVNVDCVGLDSLGLLSPIRVCEEADTTTVCFSTYWRFEVVPWCVVFSKGGDLLRIGCIQESVYVDYAGSRPDNNVFKYLGITNVRCGYEEQ